MVCSSCDTLQFHRECDRINASKPSSTGRVLESVKLTKMHISCSKCMKYWFMPYGSENMLLSGSARGTGLATLSAFICYAGFFLTPSETGVRVLRVAIRDLRSCVLTKTTSVDYSPKFEGRYGSEDVVFSNRSG